jgi:hypothetical protein
MVMAEYNAVRDMNYNEYCDYLQNKYGIGRSDYMTKTFQKKRDVTRTTEGLYVHHKQEDRVAELGNTVVAKNWPFEWQQKENLVYCDLLEHLWLHVLICKYPSPEKTPDEIVGIGGILWFIVPELNDLYSGWKTKQTWQLNCHNRVKNDKDVYYEIIKVLISFLKDNEEYSVLIDKLFSSLGEDGTWDKSKNSKIFKDILAMIKAAGWE